MSKKHYIRMARELNESKPVHVNQSDEYYYGQLATWENLVLRITSMFAEDNPQFNRVTFLKACGYS